MTRAAGGETSREIWRLFRLLGRAQGIYGGASLGPFIISMTRGPADLLSVLLLARWAGCEPGLLIVPLFETLEDLEAAPRVLAELFALPVYQAQLDACGGEQMVMIGYSDSNKESGFLQSAWALYRAQRELGELSRRTKIAMQIFHGRGGAIGRGGGPANRAILAQPHGTVEGRVRFTEQGEVIADRYGHPAIAERHLEQILNAVLRTSFAVAGDRPAG